VNAVASANGGGNPDHLMGQAGLDDFRAIFFSRHSFARK